MRRTALARLAVVAALAAAGLLVASGDAPGAATATIDPQHRRDHPIRVGDRRRRNVRGHVHRGRRRLPAIRNRHRCARTRPRSRHSSRSSRSLRHARDADVRVPRSCDVRDVRRPSPRPTTAPHLLKPIVFGAARGCVHVPRRAAVECPMNQTMQVQPAPAGVHRVGEGFRVVAIAVAVVLALAAGLRLVERPPFVDRVTVVNRSSLELDIDTSGTRSGEWTPAGVVEPGSSAHVSGGDRPRRHLVHTCDRGRSRRGVGGRQSGSRACSTGGSTSRAQWSTSWSATVPYGSDRSCSSVERAPCPRPHVVVLRIA